MEEDRRGIVMILLFYWWCRDVLHLRDDSVRCFSGRVDSRYVRSQPFLGTRRVCSHAQLGESYYLFSF